MWLSHFRKEIDTSFSVCAEISSPSSGWETGTQIDAFKIYLSRITKRKRRRDREQVEREGERKRMSFHLLVHFPNGHRAVIRPKPKVWSFLWVPLRDTRAEEFGPSAATFQRSLVGILIRSEATRYKTITYMRCLCSWQRLRIIYYIIDSVWHVNGCMERNKNQLLTMQSFIK